MRKDPTEFRERFKKWQSGEKVYEAGLPKFEGGEEKFKLKKTPEFVQAGRDNSWSKVTNDDMGEVFQSVVARPNRTGGNTSAGSWKKQWEPKYEKPLEIVSPEFDVISGIRGIQQILKPIRTQKAVALRKDLSHRKPVYEVTEENAASMTPEQWTAAQDAAIARGDMTEAQRLRDLHFETIGIPVRTQEGSIRLTHATKNKFNSFDLSKAGSGSGNTSNTEGVIHLSPYDESALDVFHTKSAEERNAYNLMHLYANNPNPVEVPLEIFVKSWNDKELFRVLRDAGDGIIARGKSPYKLYKEGLAEYESKKAAGKLMPWTRKPESPKDFMEEAVVDGYTINNPKNLKLADAVTYDDKGVRIPLGERDNFNINDIRYGIIPLISGSTGYGLYNKYAE